MGKLESLKQLKKAYLQQMFPQGGENVPRLRFAGFSEPWEQRRLGEVTTKIGSGKTPKGGSAVYLRQGIPFLRSQNITNDAVDLSDVVHISDEMDIEMSNSQVQTSDVLLNITGASIGRSAVYKHTNTANVNQHVCIIRPTEDVNADYLQLNLTSPNGQQQIDNNQAGGGREGLNFQQIAKIAFYFPTLHEQSHIGKFFRALDEQIAKQQTIVDRLKRLKAAYLQRMFPQNGETVPRLRFGGFSESWTEVALGELGETFTGLSGKTKDDFGKGDARYVVYVNVFSNELATLEGAGKIEVDIRQNHLKYGDILFTTSSETPEEVGMSSVWLHHAENVYLNSFCFGFRPTCEISSLYMAFMLRSPVVRSKIILLAQGISRYNISKTKLMETKVPLPLFNEQTAIGKFFHTLDNLIKLHN